MSTHYHVTVETHRSDASPEHVLRALVAAPNAPEHAFETVAEMDAGRDWWVDDVDVDLESAVEWAYAWAGNVHYHSWWSDDGEHGLAARAALVQRTYPGIGRLVRHRFNDTGDTGTIWVLEPAGDAYEEVEVIPFGYDFGVTPSRDVRDPRLPTDEPVYHAPNVEVVQDYLQGKYGITTWVGERNRDVVDCEWLVGEGAP